MTNETLTPEQQKAAMDQAYNNSYATLVDRVWGPVFFEKLARDWGIQPTDAEEADKLIALSHRLRAGRHDQLNKQANASKSLLDRALDDVGVALQQQGVGLPPDVAFINEAKEVAAAAVQSDPSLRDAALLYQDFLTQVLRNN